MSVNRGKFSISNVKQTYSSKKIDLFIIIMNCICLHIKLGCRCKTGFIIELREVKDARC